MWKLTQETELGVGWMRRATGRLEEAASTLRLIQDLLDKNTRERALRILSTYRFIRADLALFLWNSFGTIASLLQEIVAVYVLLNSRTISEQQLIRVLNTLELLQCVATHPDTKMLFLKADIQCYLYPFIDNTCTARTQQYLRHGSLMVIDALLKKDEAEVVIVHLEPQLVPCCLISMDVGYNMSKAVATLILQKIMETDPGLKYCCETTERCFVIIMALGNMVKKIFKDGSLAEASRIRLLNHIICCYLKLSEHPRAREELQHLLPPELTDVSFITIFQVRVVVINSSVMLLQQNAKCTKFQLQIQKERNAYKL